MRIPYIAMPAATQMKSEINLIKKYGWMSSMSAQTMAPMMSDASNGAAMADKTSCSRRPQTRRSIHNCIGSAK